MCTFSEIPTNIILIRRFACDYIGLLSTVNNSTLTNVWGNNNQTHTTRSTPPSYLWHFHRFIFSPRVASCKVWLKSMHKFRSKHRDKQFQETTCCNDWRKQAMSINNTIPAMALDGRTLLASSRRIISGPAVAGRGLSSGLTLGIAVVFTSMKLSMTTCQLNCSATAPTFSSCRLHITTSQLSVTAVNSHRSLTLVFCTAVYAETYSQHHSDFWKMTENYCFLT